MRKLALLCVISAILVLNCICRADDKSVPSTQQSIPERIRHSLLSLGSGQWITNNWLIFEQQSAALKVATAESLQKPILIASYYYPDIGHADDKGNVTIKLWWLEDFPSLKEVIVRNPETDEQLKINIPQSSKEEIERSGELNGVLHIWIDRIPAKLAGDDPTEALEVCAPGQEIPAVCFPVKLLSQPRTTVPSSMSAE